jgi:hypothetical protein
MSQLSMLSINIYVLGSVDTEQKKKDKNSCLQKLHTSKWHISLPIGPALI